MVEENMSERAQSAAREVKEHAAAGADAVERGAEAKMQKWTSQLGTRGESIAEALRTAGERLRGKEDWLAENLDAVSRHLAGLSEAAQSKEPAELKADVERFAREHPALFLGAAAAAGLALGRVLRSSVPRPQPANRATGPIEPPHDHKGSSSAVSAAERLGNHQPSAGDDGGNRSL